MILFSLFTFIVQHYLQSRVHSVVVFNCWDIKSQLNFLRNANDHLLRTKMVDINKDFEFPGENFDGPYTVLGIYVDFNCNKSRNVFSKASDLQLFVAKHNWLVVDENYNLTKFRKQFEDAMMSVDADITYAGLDKESSNLSSLAFILYDVYNNGKYLGGKLNTTLDKNVTCDSENCQTKYLSDLHLRTKYGNRCNLNDTTFRISTVVTMMSINSPEKDLLDFLSSENNSHVDNIPRSGFHVVVLLQEMMSYKYPELIFAHYNQLQWKFHSRVRYFFTNEWSFNETSGASIGDLVLGNAELSSSGFYPILPRLQYVDFILQIGDFRSVFLFRTPRNEGLYKGVFLSPFTPPAWIAFGIVLIVFAVLLWASFIIEFRIMQRIKFIPSLLLTFLITFGLACYQGAALIPRTTGGRIAFFSLSLVTFIMYNYYTSTVISSLVGSPIKSNIKSIGQLADSGLDIGIDPAPYTVTFLKISKNTDVVKLVQKKIGQRMALNTTLWLNAEDGILKVRDGSFAYHSEASTVYRAVEKHYKDHELCDLNEVKLRPENSLVTMMNKKSPYKEIVRINLIRMTERGVISKHKRYWTKTKLHCFSSVFQINIGMEYTGPLFILLGIIYILALVVLVLEIVCYKLVVG